MKKMLYRELIKIILIIIIIILMLIIIIIIILMVIIKMTRMIKNKKMKPIYNSKLKKYSMILYIRKINNQTKL